MSGMSGPAGGSTARDVGASGSGRTTRVVELVLAGLADDEDELLGDLAEGRAGVDAASGPSAARRWWRRQVVRALPRLAAHALTRHPGWLALGGLAGAVAGGAVTGGAVTMLPDAGDGGGDGASWPPTPPPDLRTFLLGALGYGLVLILAGVLAGAVAAIISRKAPLLAAAIPGLLIGYWWSWHPFYALYGSGRPVPGVTDEWMIELSSTSPDLLFPVLWELPVMAILLPMATISGGLLVVTYRRPRRRKAAG